jgi:hypothetical protein
VGASEGERAGPAWRPAGPPLQRRVTFARSLVRCTTFSMPRVWDSSARPGKRARVASPERDGLQARDYVRHSVGAHGVSEGASDSAIESASASGSVSARPLASDSVGVAQLHTPRSVLAGDTAGCCDRPIHALSLLTFARFAAAGGHTRARARRAGQPVWGEEGRPVSAKGPGGLWSSTGVQPLPNDLSEPSLRLSSHTLNSDNSELRSLANDVRSDRGSVPADRLLNSGEECDGSVSPDPPPHEGMFDSNHGTGTRASHPDVFPQGSGSEGAKPSGESDPSLSSYESLLIQLFSRIKNGLQIDPSIQDRVSREKLGLTQRGQLWWKDNLLCIPPDEQLKRDILYWHHDVPWCAHMGIQKTLELVKEAILVA